MTGLVMVMVTVTVGDIHCRLQRVVGGRSVHRRGLVMIMLTPMPLPRPLAYPLVIPLVGRRPKATATLTPRGGGRVTTRLSITRRIHRGRNKGVHD